MRGSWRAVLAVALPLLTAPVARADAGLDLLVLVDQSTSMARHRTLSSLFLRMTADLVARNATANRVEHRIAVIRFGTAARLDLPFASCRREDLPRLRTSLAALPSEDLGETDVLHALIAATKLFDTLPHDPARRRAAVLLTDGMPWIRGADMTVYRAKLQRFAAAELAARRISMHAILLDGRHRAMWQAFASIAEVARREPDQILAEAHGTIAGLLGTRTIPAIPTRHSTTDVLLVAPYLEMIVFDVFRGSADATVEVFPPSGATPIRDRVNGVEAIRAGGVLTTYVVPRPPPGQWSIRKSRTDARVRVVSQQFFPRGRLVRPAPAETLQQYDRVELAYRIVDGSGQPLRELPSYAVALHVSVTSPTGSSTPVTMHRTPELGPSLFRSTTLMECTVAGRYWVDVTVATTDANGQRLELFRDRWSGFSASPAERVDCHVQASGGRAWLPVVAQVACFDARERAIDMNVVATQTDLFRASLWRDGRPTEATLDLQSAGLNAFRGRLRGACRSGSYRLQFGANRAAVRAPYNVRFVPAEIAFRRHSLLEWLAAALATTGLAVLLKRGMKFRRR